MNYNSDLKFLIQLKTTLIQEIKVLESCYSNESFFVSLPVNSIETHKTFEKYILTNNFDINKTIQQKRSLLNEVNITLKQHCNHKTVEGKLNISGSNKEKSNFCILCMNFL